MRYRLPRGARASWWVLGLTWLLWFMNANDRELMYRVQPAIVKEWGLSSARFGFYVSVFFFTYAVVAFVAGIHSDHIGRGWRRRTPQCVYMLVLTTASVLVGIRATSAQLWNFVLWRTLGLGSAGGAEVTNVALCSEYWPREDRGFALGLHHTGYPFGALLGGLATAGILAAYGPDDWRYAFLITPILGYLLVLALWAYARPRTHAQVDAYARERGLTPPEAEAEEKVPAREQWRRIWRTLKNRNVLVCVLCAFLINFALSIVQFALPFYFNFARGSSVSVTAVLGVVPYITGWFGQLLWGTVSDYLGRRKTLAILSLWYAVGIALLVPVTGKVGVVVVLLFWGLALNAVFPVFYAMIADHAPSATGSAMGLLLMLTFFGQVPATPLGGYLIDVFGGYHAVGGYVADFAIGAAAAIVALLLIWMGTRDVARTPVTEPTATTA